MAKLPGMFNADNHEDMSDFSVLPSGNYVAKVVGSELKDTKDPTNDNKYLNFKFEVVDGDYKGRNFWSRMNIVNKSAQAAEIAQKEFATLCRACGKVSVEETEVLHDIPIVVKIKAKPATANNPESNQVMNYGKYDGSPVNSPSKADGAASSNGNAKATPW